MTCGRTGLPVEEPDLTVYTEHGVLLLATDHEPAGEKSVSLEVSGDRGIPRDSPGPDYRAGPDCAGPGLAQ